MSNSQFRTVIHASQLGLSHRGRGLFASARAFCETRYNPHMIRRFLQLLVVALTLQLTWGVASAYCGHESGEASQHFGHHQHQHQSSKVSDDEHDDDDDAPAPGTLGGDPDCASCAHSPANILPFTSPPLVILVVTHNDLLSRTGQPPPFLGAPERPQWGVAA